MSKDIKLPGVTLDDKLTFNKHVANVCSKAVGVYKQLCRAAKTTWSLQPEVIKVIYAAAMGPIILYAASVLAPVA